MDKPDDETTAREMAAQEYEPLLMAEKVMIVSSLTLGLVLLVVLYLWTR